jgi:uncharacterized protein YndB with AHSA1/START domain
MRQVIHSIEIAVPPSQAIQAFLDPAQLRGWWGVERCLIEPRKGGLFTLAWAIFENGIKYISTGVFKTCQPGKRLFIEKYAYLNPERTFLGPQELEVTASRTAGGCLLTVRQGPYPENAGADWDWFYEAVVEAWQVVLKTLRDFLEKQTSLPL